jgi:hypothetical protein
MLVQGCTLSAEVSSFGITVGSRDCHHKPLLQGFRERSADTMLFRDVEYPSSVDERRVRFPE